MSTQVQYRRGSNVQVAAFTGALGEIVVDTTNKVLVVNDGIQAGGFPQVGLTAAQTITNKVYNGTSLSVTGNVTAGGAIINGDLSVTGNATLSGNILGDRIQNGTTIIDIQTANGNANITVGGTSNVAVFATTGAFITGVNSVSGNIDGGNLRTAGLISATGNITGSFILGNGSQLTGIDATSIQSGTSNVKVVSSGGNVTTSIGGTSNVVVVATTGQYVTGINSVSGAITAGGDLSLIGNIVDTGPLTIITSSNGNIGLAPNGTGNVNIGGNIMPTANATANIGSAALSFNTIFARATSAQYADLAEMYVADAEYTPGTVIDFGGNNEVTVSTQSHSTQVAGIVSTNPSYLMNATQSGDHVVAVALTGRVPCKVMGSIRKGDRLVSSSVAGVATVLDINNYQPGCIVGKALENYNSDTVGIIEVAVGRT